MSSELNSYFERLRSSLQVGQQAEDDVIRELRSHAEDRLAELERSGLTRGEAARALLGRLERPRSLARQFREAHSRASWQDASAAAAAFLLASALYATHLWSHPGAVIAVASVIVGVTLYGLWQGRPAWFYPWAGLALTLLSFCGFFAFTVLKGGIPPLSEGKFDAVTVLGVAGAALYVPLAVAILASCILVASRRDWLDASLMLSPSAPVVVWLAVVHQHGGVLEARASVAGADTALAAAFIAMAGAAAVFVRVRTRSAKLTTMIVTAALLLITASYIYDPQLSLATLTARSFLLCGFLLSPAALDALVARPPWPAAASEE